MAEVPEPGAGRVAGLNVTVVPLGIPEADRLTELLNPLLTVTVMVEVPWASCRTVRELGDAEMVNVGWLVTVSVTVVLRCTPPPLPVTVMG